MHRSWWLIALVGCYRPAALDDCLVVCGAGSSSTCPPGQECDGNGKCKSVDRAENCPATGEDAPTPDAFEFQDAGPDSMLTPGATCWGQAGDFFTVCFDPGPTTSRTITAAETYSTVTCTGGQLQTQALPPAVCVLAYDTFTITSTGSLRVVGGRPLAIVAKSSMTIDGTIDVSSSHGGAPGPNANVSDCNIPLAGEPAAGGSAGGGGGAGGALAFDSGTGGAGTGGSQGGTETMALEPPRLLRIRGGCPGASGGKSTTDNPGLGGAGGGAIYLMSKGALGLGSMARINASGAGGAPPGARAGGGGGGSGGFIGFHAATLNFAATAKIYAIGGGGASGGGGATPGKQGPEATGPFDTAVIIGSGGGGSGGLGAILKGGSGEPAPATGGGGGGGGGGGRIGFEGQVPQDGQFAPPLTNL